jgi:phosphinothricin acetyltransferase
MNIRIAELSDLPSIVDIYNQAISAGATGHTEAFTVDSRREWFLSHSASRPLLVAPTGTTIVGWSNLTDYRPGRQAFQQTAEVSYYVHSEHRRQGVAAALVSHMMKLAPSLKVRTLIAIILETNLASARLMERLGFSKWAELPLVARLNNQDVGHVYYGLRLPP